MEKKEYCTPVVWGAVAFMFFGAGLMYYWYITGVTVPFQITPGYSLGMMFIFLFGAACTGTSCRLTETDITFRLFGIPLQKKSWSRFCRIVYFHTRCKSETFSELYSTCLILYKDFPHYPQKDKTSWDDFLLLLFQLRHPRSVHSIHVPNKTRAEFLAAIKDLSRLPVEEILPGASQKAPVPSPARQLRTAGTGKAAETAQAAYLPALWFYRPQRPLLRPEPGGCHHSMDYDWRRRPDGFGDCAVLPGAIPAGK